MADLVAPARHHRMIAWNRIDTVLLDMDGTLLDLHFDNHFWLEHVPRRYAEARGLALDAARADLAERYRRVEGTLEWYCVDYWSEQLGLDIPLLKQEVEHLIAVHPQVPEFLAAVRASGKRLLLVTNAHGKALALKLRRTPIGQYFDAIVCAHDLAWPKERAEFWHALARTQPFAREAALLIDDSLPVLRAARGFGVAQLLAVRRPDSKRRDKDVGEFAAISNFGDLMPIR
jgi:putative hydrolase of the HAD superfamily